MDCAAPAGSAALHWVLRHFDQMVVQALGDGVMDAIVMVRYESHMRPAEAGTWPGKLTPLLRSS